VVLRSINLKIAALGGLASARLAANIDGGLDFGGSGQDWIAMLSGKYFFHQKLRDPDPATKDIERQDLSRS
jgi:hypothetical protein